jgi:multiple sugar transport system substrate-binding protein
MTTLELSVISNFALEQILQSFEKQNGHTVNVRKLTWDTAWSEIIREAIHRNPIDVSEVGSSWISDLRAMDVLHSFSEDEITSIEGSHTFLPASWDNCTSPLDYQVWSIPWTVDTRFVYYRRDMLEKAGVNPATAFVNHESMIATLQALKASGIPNPLALPTRRTRMLLHNTAPWVWGNGGDFISSDAKTALFAQPEALQGFCQHFELAQFIATEARNLESVQSEALYRQGKAAVTISGPWLLHEPDTLDEVRAHTEFTFPPGVPFVGGTNLILWQQSANTQASLALIQFLTSVDFQSTYFKNSGYLPSRLDALASSAFSKDARFQSLALRLKQGRSFKPMPLWGWLEERLTASLRLIWDEIFMAVDGNSRPTVEKHLPELERRVNLTLRGK